MSAWARYEPYDLALQGRIFHVSFNTTITAGATAWAQVKTNNKKVTVVHYELVSLTENMRFSVFEAPTITDGTTAMTSRNVNRNYTETATTQLFSNPTNVSGGTLLLIHGMPSGANKVGGTSGHSETWTLKPSTSYGLKMENLGNSTNEFVFNMSFYEV